MRYEAAGEAGPVRPVVVACLGGITAFQAALAAGAPLGALAYGGFHEGVLPTSLRVASGIAALGWGAAMVAVTTERPSSDRGQRLLFAGLAGVAALGAFVNLASPSLPERLLWVPVTTVLAVAAWHESRSVRQRRRWPVLRSDDDRRAVDVPRHRAKPDREPVSA